MLINCDFERHGFECFTTEDNLKIYAIPPYSNIDQLCLKVRREKKGMSRVELYRGKLDMDAYEIMWHPTQLREFLLFHKVIEDNKKL